MMSERLYIRIKGLLAIGDTLYKVQDEYIYRIPKNSQINLSEVESDPEKYQEYSL